MSILSKIWRLFKVTKVLMSLNSMKLARLLSSPTSPKRLTNIPKRSLSNCIPDHTYDQEYNIDDTFDSIYKNEEAHKRTPFVSASSTPFPIDQSPSEEDKKFDDFISKMKSQISLEIAYARSPISPLPLPPILPDSFEKMKEKVPVIRLPTGNSRMGRRTSSTVHRPMEMTR